MERWEPSWNPRTRRQLATALTSLDETVERAREYVAELEARQAAHEALAVEQRAEFEERRLTAQATSARRLAVTIAAVADPPGPVVALLGQRSTTQRHRLRWDSAVEVGAVYLDGHDRRAPASAESVSSASFSARRRNT
jgi:hypothetical protein